MNLKNKLIEADIEDYQTRYNYADKQIKKLEERKKYYSERIKKKKREIA